MIDLLFLFPIFFTCMKNFLIPVLLLSAGFNAQAPAGYYNGTSGLTGYALKSKLHEIIAAKNISWNYSDLTSYYNQTDLDRYYDHGASNTTLLLDMYSEIPSGPDAYEYTTANLIGSAGAEGQGWNREHMMPQSTFYSNYPMYSDLFYVVPTDARINQLRSNYPYGIVGSAIYYTFTNTSRIGNSAIPGSNYTGRVYEPVNEFKGDIARSLLYFAVRYEGKMGSFNVTNTTSPASDTNPLDGTEERAYDPAYIAMLLQWHQQDPVSQREIDRNNAVYTLQKNRNPFIDNPAWADMIWGASPDSALPQSPSNIGITKNSAYFVTLSWAPSPSSDVIGYKVYQNGTLVASTKDNTVSIDHLTPSTQYSFTVKAYDSGYLLSADSNTVSITTLASDLYAKDLMISKYLEGTGNNKGLEIINRTGHTVNMNDYRLSIQFLSGSNYYFPAPYELEGTLADNETSVIINAHANFSCYASSQARFVTAAPQMMFSGSQYLELKYRSATVDALGIPGTNNSSTLANVSLYRKQSAAQPAASFSLNEWEAYPVDYCQNMGTLSARDEATFRKGTRIYPNPVREEIFVTGNTGGIKTVQILDYSGKLIYTEQMPFRNKKSISVQSLAPGTYLLRVDDRTYPFIKE